MKVYCLLLLCHLKPDVDMLYSCMSKSPYCCSSRRLRPFINPSTPSLFLHFPPLPSSPNPSSLSTFLLLPFLGNPNHSPRSTTNRATTIGIRTCTPAFCAIAPTANGKTAAPPPPTAAANPIAETCKCLGRRAVAATMAPGNRGARQRPSRETKTAEARKEGTSQKRRWNVMARVRYICWGSEEVSPKLIVVALVSS